MQTNSAEEEKKAVPKELVPAESNPDIIEGGVKPKWKRPGFIVAIMLLLIAGVIILIWCLRGGLPDGLIQANGRIEGDRVSVASKFPGRIEKLLVREGDSVKSGQILAILEDAQIQARVSQAREAVSVLESQLKAAQTLLEIMIKEVPLEIDIARESVASSGAVLEQAKAGERQSSRDAMRFRELLESGTVDSHRSEMADLSAIAAASQLEAARTGLTRMERLLSRAKLGNDKIRAQADGVAALSAMLAQGNAALVEAESVLNDLSLVAPISGVITTRIRDSGEVIGAGSPVFDLVDLDRLYLKVYVPEAQIGKLRLNLPGIIYTDAFPDKPFPATARYISSRAEFTPKEVQTPDERVKLVYAVKLYLDANPNHSLTPGLPADAVIRWKEGVQWQKPIW